jgi:CubicO group peptidase (beta-lactamase class C family)
MTRFFPATLLVALLGSGVALPEGTAQFTPFERAIAEFDAEVAAGVARDGAGAVSAAVFLGKEVIWSKGYGWADIENRIAATQDTIGRTGSITKSFTAVLMMQLAERGLLDIDQPVEKYLPEIKDLAHPPEGAKPITFRMLASHTAGLAREPELEGAAEGSIYRWEEKLLASIPRTRFKAAPGTEYSYSNIGFGILGLACSRAAGLPFMELVEKQIFVPLGMTSSTFIVNRPDMWARLAVGYDQDSETRAVSSGQSTREHLGRGYKVPNGGIYSTVGDLARFAAAMMGESGSPILSAESRREMLTPQPPATAYGLGFRLVGEVAGHGGSVAGYNAELTFHLPSKLGVVVLRTTSYSPPADMLLLRLLNSK